MGRDRDDARGSARSLYTTRTIPYGHTVAGVAIGGLGHERSVDGCRPKAAASGLAGRAERVKVPYALIYSVVQRIYIMHS